MAEDLDLEFQAWFQEAVRKVQGGQQDQDSTEEPEQEEEEE